MRFLREDQTLNKVERIKQARHPLEVRQAIIDTYSKDLSAMDEVPGEVERLKWVGIYPQKQGGDAFMMRIKIPGGVLTPEQTKVIGRIAADFARGPIPNPHFGNNFLDLTTRQDVQMHWLKMENIPEIWRRLEGGRHHHRAGLRRLGPQRPVLPRLRPRPPRGHRRLSGGAGDKRVLHGKPRVRQFAPQVQDERHGMPGGLRAGGDQRRRYAPRPPGRRHARLQPARRRRPLRRPQDGLRYRRLRQAGGGRGDHTRHSPGLRRARRQGEPLDRENALPGPGTRPRKLPRRAREARLCRPDTRRRRPHQEIPRRPHRRPPAEGQRPERRGRS